MIHFELIFVYGVRSGSILFIDYPFVEKRVLSLLNSLSYLSKLIDQTYLDLFVYSILFNYMLVFVPIPYCLDSRLYNKS